MSLLRLTVNQLWRWSCRGEARRFAAATRRVADVQRRYLEKIIAQNSSTVFGVKHGFSKIRTIAEFQSRVSVSGYRDYEGYIEDLARGRGNVLTAGAVKLFHPTSGSSSARKLIPWTPPLAAEFRRAIAPWLHTLYSRRPAIMRGTCYWSLSPPLTVSERHGSLKVGFESDAQYLGRLDGRLFALAQSPPLTVSADDFRLRAAVSLLADENLALISVWSPTFLTGLLKTFLAQPDTVCRLLHEQGFSRRAKILENFSGFHTVWRNLRVISCWTHAGSEPFARELQHYFPAVEIEGKGLVATEAFVSLPWLAGRDPALAVTAHFFEFENLADGKIYLAHELRRGEKYALIVTTGGGLYRYRLGDVVQVTSQSADLPHLRFIGREGVTADWCGEKLDEIFVADAVGQTLRAAGMTSGFALLAPVRTDSSMFYTLFLAADRQPPLTLSRLLDGELCHSFHYRQCRSLGQLAAARVFIISDHCDPVRVYEQTMQRRGLKLGDIKLRSLDARDGWEREFHGSFCGGG